MEQTSNQSPTEEKGGPRNPSLLGMIWEPVQQFERIRERPQIVVPLLVVLLLSTMLSIAMVEPSMELPEYQMTIEQLGEEGARTTAYVFASIGMMFLIPLLILIMTLLHWLLTLFFQGSATFVQLFSLNTYVQVFTILSNLVLTVYLWTIGVGESGLIPPTSVAALVSVDGFWQALLSGIEVFAIWQLIVTALGLSVIARISRGKAWVAALAPFLLVLLVISGVAVIGDAFIMEME